jgi:hypothetical protein
MNMNYENNLIVAVLYCNDKLFEFLNEFCHKKLCVIQFFLGLLNHTFRPRYSLRE